jgi:sugar phosphate isomerase/epimerase
LRAPSIKTSIATVSISGTFLEKLEAIAAAGFDGIEVLETGSWRLARRR